jgi:hypothetical protein
MVCFQTKNPDFGKNFEGLAMAIWYILWSFGIFHAVLVFCTKKNLATCILSRKRRTGVALERGFFLLIKT